MRQIEVPDKTRDRFAELLRDCGAILRANQMPVPPDSPLFEAVTDVFFDLDRLWHQSDCLRQLMRFVRSAADDLERQSEYDTIVPVVSAVGSFGPTPWASILARQKRKSLLLLSEIRFGNLSVYPLTSTIEELLSNRRVLLVKDVILHGGSVQHAARLIHKHEGHIAALLTLVDMKPPQRRYDFSDLGDTSYIALLERHIAEGD